MSESQTMVRRRARSAQFALEEEKGISCFQSGGVALVDPPATPIRRGGRREADRAEGRARRRDRYVDLACRGINVVAASLGLILAAPVMLVIALLVKLSSPGPVIYTQKRVGIDRRSGGRRRPGEERRRRDTGGRLFTIYKFRTMRPAAPNGEEKQVWASEGDPRITSIGKVLRKFRLDELPQLFNVLKGDMNLVGPRPEQPEIFQELREELDGYQVRQKVLPGITGWAQINHHYDQCIDDVKKKVELDLQYIERRSAMEDLKIMVRTVPVMVGRKGAM